MLKIFLLFLFINIVICQNQTCITFDYEIPFDQLQNKLYNISDIKFEFNVPLNQSNLTHCKYLSNLSNYTEIYVITNISLIAQMNIANITNPELLNIISILQTKQTNFCNLTTSFSLLCKFASSLYPAMPDITTRNLTLDNINITERILNNSILSFLNSSPSNISYSFMDIFNVTYVHIVPIQQSFKTSILSYIPQQYKKFKQSFKSTHFYSAWSNLKKHIYKPYGFYLSVYNNPRIHYIVNNYINKGTKSLKQTLQHIDYTLNHYKNIKLKYKNESHWLSVTESVLHQIDTHNNKLHHSNKKDIIIQSKYTGLTDLNNQIDITSFGDIYNITATIISWLFHINGTYNASGCLQQGFPFLIVYNDICLKPKFKVDNNVTSLFTDLNPSNPLCQSFNNPFYLIKYTIYIISYVVGISNVYQTHPNIFFFKLFVYYDISNGYIIPQHDYICWATRVLLLSFLISLILFVYFIYLLSMKVIADVDRKIDVVKVDKMKDFASYVPEPDKTSDYLNGMVDKFSFQDDPIKLDTFIKPKTE